MLKIHLRLFQSYLTFNCLTMMFDIQNKVAVVTGGVSGIGFSTAKELLQNGLKGVTLADINEELAQGAVEEIKQEFGNSKVIYVKTDVSDKTQFEEAFKATVAKFGGVDILLNCAGSCNEVDWEKEILINLNGTINGTLLAFEEYLPKYRSSSEGVIVNISSIAGVDIYGFLPIYSATKHGIIGFSRCFGVEEHYNRTKVRVVVVCPGATITKMIDRAPDKWETLGPPYLKILLEHSKDFKNQPPQAVAKAVVQVIREASSGSVWIAENSKPPLLVNAPLKYPRDTD